MEGKRLYEVAKEMNLSSEALVKLLRRLGFKVKGYMSVVTEDMANSVRRKMSDSRRKLKEKDKAKKRIRLPKSEKRKRKKVIEQKKVKEKVKETLARISRVEPSKKKKIKPEVEHREETETVKKIKVAELVSVQELARLLDTSPVELIKKCLELGLAVTINQRLNYETAETIASEYGYEAELISYYEATTKEDSKKYKKEPRAPIVTVMGHVDHGKTSLLDKIRESSVTETEKGGITQHIGAYMVNFKGRKITFLDTPGHEAFTAMRARGAQVTDIVLLVIAADDGVMPQTVEALDHARDAGVPIIIAINKVDLPSANPGKVKRQIGEHRVVLEEDSGDVMAVEVSAKTGKGISDLLDSVLIKADTMELASTRAGNARGWVIESRLDRGKGAVATVLIISGTLHKFDPFVAGVTSGRVKAMYDEFGSVIEDALPSTPLMVLGFDAMPKVGDSFVVFDDEREAREIARRRRLAIREHLQIQRKPLTLEGLQEEIRGGETKELRLIIKGDVGGSVEALSDSAEDLSTEEIKIRVIHEGIGEINESDILLASASGAIVIGFNVKINSQAEKEAQKDGIDIRIYDVIYKAIEEIQLAMAGLLEPKIEKKELGRAEVRQIFTIPNMGSIAGCYITDGKITVGSKVEIMRKGEVVGEEKVSSLKRYAKDVKEIHAGTECGIGLMGTQKFKKGDILQAYIEVEKK